MGRLRKLINSIIKEAFSASVINKPPANSIQELKHVINQYYNRYNPENVQELCDTGMEHLFNQIIKMSGYKCDIQKIKSLKNDKVLHEIDVLKRTFRRDRPYQYAQKLGISWRGDGYEMDTDNTFSYPSGHACQAYYIAHCLSADYPELNKHFFEVAEMVSQSRIDRGVHFPSDCEAGKALAMSIYRRKR